MCDVFRETQLIYSAVRYGLIESMRRSYPIALMCRVLNVSENGFHVQRTRPLCNRKRENIRLEVEMLAAHQRTRETYSATRLHHDWRITKYKPRYTAFEKIRQQAFRRLPNIQKSSITDRENRKSSAICHQHNLRSNTMQICLLLKPMDSIFDSTPHMV